MNKRLLIIDDEESICLAFKRFFQKREWTVDTAASLAKGRKCVETNSYDIVFLDVRLPDGNGLEFLDELMVSEPGRKVVVISAYGTLETVTRAVAGKAFDYLAKPLDLDQALGIVERAEQTLEGEAAPKPVEDSFIVGSSKVMQEVYKRIGLVAMADSNVLIYGETGTGKELVARAIHKHSNRCKAPIVAVNCGALPENLVESELFGYEKGAFTGAVSRRKGKFEAADGGVLFLDEIGELPPAAQTKLLRVLDSNTIERLGSVTPVPVDVRILTASNRKLADEVKAGRFREDLFYRLNVIHLELPPLRERRGDIMLLAQSFAAGLSPKTGFSNEAEKRLINYNWPGNVRELRNAVEHAIIVSAGANIQPEHLPDSISFGAQPGEKPNRKLLDEYLGLLRLDDGDIYTQAVEPVEKSVICLALKHCHGKRSDAATLLGIHRNTLRLKIEALGIEL